MNILPKKIPFRLHKKVQPMFAIVGLLVLLFLLLQLSFVNSLLHGVQQTLSQAGTGIGNTWSRIFYAKDSVHAQRDRYQSLAASLALEQSRVHQLEQDVEELESLLNYKDTYEISGTVARIIARSVNGNQTILVDKGSADGIREHLPVVIEEGHVIGYTTEVGKHSSVILLLSDSASSVPATILGEEETLGIIEGQDGFLFHMQYIPQSKDIDPEDVVVTSGLDQNSPHGLVIGIVTEVIKNESDPFQQAFIEPLVDLRRVRNVLILDPAVEL